MISQTTIQKINEEARIEEVVGEFVILRKRGSNLIGLCPFHNEKTPSFHVSPSKGIYKCFGCGKAGGAISFLMDSQQMSYVDSLRFLAEKYKIEIEESAATEVEKEDVKRRESLFIVNQFACKFFEKNLWETEIGQAVALAYFRSRGFTDHIIQNFQLGFASATRDQLTSESMKAGYSLELLKAAGLTSKTEGSKNDFFIDRVMFPIHNPNGKVIAFGGRTLKSDKNIPKYLNTGETEIYEKSKVLYGMFQAKQEIRRKDECYLCEGYTDVLAMHQAGITNAVASSGTALTPEQVKLVKRSTDNLTIVYDGDAAGIKAALRGIDIAIEGGLNVRIVLLPDGEDPDSYTKKNGAEAVSTFLQSHKQDFILFKSSLLKEEAKGDPVKRAELSRDIIETIAKVSDPLKRAEYLRECSRILEIREQTLIGEVNKIIKKKLYEPNPNQPISYVPDDTKTHHDQNEFLQTEVNHAEVYERDIIRILVEYGNEVDEDNQHLSSAIFAEIESAYFTLEKYRALFEKLSVLSESGSKKMDFTQLDSEMNAMVIDIQFSPHQISPNWTEMHEIIIPSRESIIAKDVKNSTTMFKLYKINELIEKNMEEIKNAKSQEELQMLLQKDLILKSDKRKISAELGIVIHGKLK